jgi:hypothetical protein
MPLSRYQIFNFTVALKTGVTVNEQVVAHNLSEAWLAVAEHFNVNHRNQAVSITFTGEGDSCCRCRR